MTTPYLDWVRDTRQARVTAPALTCDCAVHIYRPMGVGTLTANRRYDPPQASIEDLERVHAAMGVQRSVIVQASIYGTDPTVMTRVCAVRASTCSRALARLSTRRFSSVTSTASLRWGGASPCMPPCPS